MTTPPRAPRPAATLILVRDSQHGLEVFLMQRTTQAAFMAGAHVFPGGALDPSDHDAATHAISTMDDATASKVLGLERDGLAYWIAAVRECFEESGLLLATDSGDNLIQLDAIDSSGQLRQQLAAGDLSLTQLCLSRGWRLAVDRLAYLSHWITPVGMPRRFDTRFFVAIAPAGQTGRHDDSETIANVWLTPHQALKGNEDGELTLAHATQATLKLLQQFADTDALMAHAKAPRKIVAFNPRVTKSRSGRRVIDHNDPPYAEIGKLDPTGEGNCWSEIIPGTPTVLSERVTRIAAPNPGFMTGPGTNSYLVGDQHEMAVIDPGPDIAAHIDALAHAAGGALRYIITTHTHRDHSPAAARLRQLTGAQIIGMPAPPTEFQDSSFHPDRVPKDGERLRVGNCTLRVIHTPGHASNHCCYLLEEEKLLFTGDHIMQGSTVVINPPDGDMAVYLASLRKIAAETLTWLAPGHGFLMDSPQERIERLLAHRHAREAKVLECLESAGPLSLPDLVPLVYDDVPVQRHEMAARSLRAHLDKLLQEQRVSFSDELWQRAQESR